MKIYMKTCWACFLIVALFFEQATSNPEINLLQKVCNQYNASRNLSSGLNATFSDLRRQLLHDEKHFATAELSSHEEMVFTMVQCRNYLSTEDCVKCFDAATLELENCSFAGNGAWVIYDSCFLRYANTFFYDQTTLPGSDANCGNQSAKHSTIFDIDVGIFVKEVQSSMTDGTFAAIKREFIGGGAKDEFDAGSSGHLYGVAQCIETINQAGCLDCLGIAHDNIQNCFHYTEGRATDVACFLMYSTRPFFADNQTTTSRYETQEMSRKMQLTGVIVGGGVGISIFILILWYTVFKHERGGMHSFIGSDQKIEAFMKRFENIGPKQYSYSEIVKMTNSFKDKIGGGGYGFVYKGKLPDGQLVAVKVSKGKTIEGEDFINEVASISRTSHVNVVTLLGFCFQMNTRVLIFEFMPNGSLDKFIQNNVSSSDSDRRLGWKTLFEIAVGTARGLEYLHRGCNARIVHFDIKPHNILLDEDFCPKISDFGLAKLSETKQSIFSSLSTRGTIGYIAPEVFCRNFGKVSHKSDVHSYGMMILEMVGVRTYNGGPVERSSQKYFPNWIYEHLQLGKDLAIQVLEDEEEEIIARKLILVGLWCIQTNPFDRPSMSKVVDMLEDCLHSIQIPSTPFLYSPPPRTPHETSPESPGESSSSVSQ